MPVRQDLSICLWLDLFKRLVYVLGRLALSQILTVLLDLAGMNAEITVLSPNEAFGLLW